MSTRAAISTACLALAMLLPSCRLTQSLRNHVGIDKPARRVARILDVSRATSLLRLRPIDWQRPIQRTVQRASALTRDVAATPTLLANAAQDIRKIAVAPDVDAMGRRLRKIANAPRDWLLPKRFGPSDATDPDRTVEPGGTPPAQVRSLVRRVLDRLRF